MAIQTKDIAAFLSQNKYLSLEKIGIITLRDNTSTTKEDNLHETSVEFIADKQAKTSEELYKYIAEITQKKWTIAKNDVDAFIAESRQLMNIGSRPLKIDGIGYITNPKNQGYRFSSTAPDSNFHLTQKQEAYDQLYQEQVFLSNTKQDRNKAFFLKFLISLLSICLLVGISYFLYDNFLVEKPMTVENSFTTTQQDSSPEADTTTTNTSPITENILQEKTYKFVFETTTNESRAENRAKQLKEYGNQVLIDTTTDTMGKHLYKLYLTIQNLPPTDTLKVKDSLSKYFGRKVTIE